MNLKDIFNGLLHVLHILGNEKGDQTTITSYDPFSTTISPVIIDTTTLANIASSSDRSVSPKFTFLPSGSYETTHENFEKEATTAGTVTGETPVTEVHISSTISPDTTSGSTGQSKSTTPGPKTESTVNTKDLSTVTGSGTTITGKTGTVTGETGTGSTVTGKTGSASTVTGKTGSGSTVTGQTGSGSTVTGKTGSGSTVTGETGSGSTVTGETGSGSTATGKTGSGSTVTGKTGSGSTVTGSGSSVSDTTDVAPTKEPSSGLSRGAVAGIVIGCLLLVAVVAAAIVFFVKNRNTPPEHQRLRV